MLDDFHTALGSGLVNAAARAKDEKELRALEQRWTVAIGSLLVPPTLTARRSAT